MSINATTLSAAIGANDTALLVASATGITAPNNQTGAGVTLLYVENEIMGVTAVNGTYVNVTRGLAGTQALAHSASAPVLAGLATDFPKFTPAIGAFVTKKPNRYDGVYAPVAAAATITPSGPIFHVTGHTATSKINAPSSDFVEGQFTVIADDTWTWTSATTPGSLAQAGAVTSAGSCVTFVYDAATALWYASRNS